MPEKILFVDDVAAVLEGYKRLLYRDFMVDTAVGGEEGLHRIATRGPYAVVVSDMRMPGMNGVEFLLAVKVASPDSVRMILTGYAEIEAAIKAVNEGNVFRFLTKPCPRDALIAAIHAGLNQYRLIVAERELLEKTLRGCMQTMSEILAITNPAAFGRSTRLQRYVHYMTETMELPSKWQYEVAALLSQLGCVTLHPDTVEAVNAGQKLEAEEKKRYDKHPAVAYELLSHIPRMEEVAWIVLQQQGEVTSAEKMNESEDGVVGTGAALLRTAVGYDVSLSEGLGHREAVARLMAGAKGLELAAATALSTYEAVPAAVVMRSCEVSSLAVGMTLDEDIRTKNGMLVVGKGQEISSVLAARLSTFCHHGVIAGEVRVRMPAAQATG